MCNLIIYHLLQYTLKYKFNSLPRKYNNTHYQYLKNLKLVTKGKYRGLLKGVKESTLDETAAHFINCLTQKFLV